MLNRTASLAAALTIAAVGFATVPAQAQTNYFGVESSSQTLGYPGTFTQNSYIPGGLFTQTLSDPTGATLSGPTSSGYADVGAGTEAQPSEIRAWASGHAHVVTGQSFTSAAPYGFAYGHYYDRLLVKSDTLVAGTPVTIVFGNDVEITRWDRVGLYDGYIEMTLQIGAGSARSRWSSSYIYGDTTAVAPQLQIKTTVGSRLSVDAKLRVLAKVFYSDLRVANSGDNHADATARLVIREITEGVTLQSDSGVTYPFVPAN